MKICKWKFKRITKKQLLSITTTLVLTAFHLIAMAQDGNAGINEANTKVRSYFDSGTNLMYAVGALLGLIGAVKVYQKWNAGDQDTGKVAAAKIKKSVNQLFTDFSCAQNRNRTCTSLRTTDFESVASTNSAIWAFRIQHFLTGCNITQ
jgi:hypothetical protein